MDKPIRTLKEWLERYVEHSALDILRDWERNKEILEARIEDLEDKLHECLCGDLETALGRIKELEPKLKRQLEIYHKQRKTNGTLCDDIDRLTKNNKILNDAVDDYEAIGERMEGQSGNWILFHAGATEYIAQEFTRLKQARQSFKKVDNE